MRSVASGSASGSSAPEFIRLPECETTAVNELDENWKRRGKCSARRRTRQDLTIWAGYAPQESGPWEHKKSTFGITSQRPWPSFQDALRSFSEENSTGTPCQTMRRLGGSTLARRSRTMEAYTSQIYAAALIWNAAFWSAKLVPAPRGDISLPLRVLNFSPAAQRTGGHLRVVTGDLASREEGATQWEGKGKACTTSRRCGAQVSARIIRYTR